MSSAGLSHSDHNRFAHSGETDTDQVHSLVAAVDLITQYLLEPLPPQRLERAGTALFLKLRLGRTVEPVQRAGTIAAGHSAKEGGYDFLRVSRWSLRTAEARRSNQ